MGILLSKVFGKTTPVSQSPMEAAGYTIDNHKLGEGAFGSVWKGKAKDGQLVAIKRMQNEDKEMAEDEFNIHRILSDVDSGGFLIRMLAMIQEDNITNLVMDFADGGDLHTAAIKNRITPSEVRFFFIQLINGLSFIHSKGIVHKDIKPGNLLLMGRSLLKIADFGVAAQFQKNGKELYLNGGSGTDQYAAPEVWQGKKIRGPPLDIWSAGVVLMHIAIGSTATWKIAISNDAAYWRWRSQASLEKDPWLKMNRPITEVVRMILEHDPKKRAMIQNIRSHSWFQNVPVSVTTPKSPKQSSAPKRRIKTPSCNSPPPIKKTRACNLIPQAKKDERK